MTTAEDSTREVNVAGHLFDLAISIHRGPNGAYVPRVSGYTDLPDGQPFYSHSIAPQSGRGVRPPMRLP